MSLKTNANSCFPQLSLCKMESQNSTVNELPTVDSLPDGFVEALGIRNPEQEEEEEEEEVGCGVVDYKEEKLVESGGRDSDDVQFDLPSSSSSTTIQGDAPVPLSLHDDATNQHNKATSDHSDTKTTPVLGTSSAESDGNHKKEASEVKRKSSKRSVISEKEFLEFTLKYQQILAERDSAIAVRDKLESLCRELQKQNKMLTDECRRVSTLGQNLRLDLSNKFEDAIKEVSIKLEQQKDECILQLKENEMLRLKLKQFADQYALSEQQHEQQLKQKSLELQIAELKIQQYEEKLVHEQAQMKLYAEQISQLLTTEKNLRLQLTADGEKFQQFQEALLKSNEVFESFKKEIEKMSKTVKDVRKENAFLKSKCDKSDVTLIELAEERERLKKQLEKTRNQKEKLESLCRSLQAERKASAVASSGSDSAPV